MCFLGFLQCKKLFFLICRALNLKSCTQFVWRLHQNSFHGLKSEWFISCGAYIYSENVMSSMRTACLRKKSGSWILK